MRVYISGAITGNKNYIAQFLNAEHELKALGFEVVNPARLNNIMPKSATYEEYMDMCIDLLRICDNIYMLKGWHKSAGANREYGYALASGKTIIKE